MAQIVLSGCQNLNQHSADCDATRLQDSERENERSASALPPLSEQRAIAEFLDTKLMDTHRRCLSSQVEGAIERLQEYRTALITAAVTGKIDVREHEQVEIGASRT